MNNIKPERLEKLIEVIKESKFSTVDQLCGILNVSPCTIRRDLILLEKSGDIRRFHGGALLNKNLTLPFYEREKIQVEAKRKIAQEAIKNVKDNSTLILDAGTTVARMAIELEKISKSNLTIITPTMNIAQILLGRNFKILLSGGLVCMESNSLVGQLALDCFSKLRADLAFMSCESITDDFEVMYPDLEIMQIKKAIINSAVIKILLVDSSKFGRVSLSSLGDISLFDLLIVDDEIEKKYLKELEKRNIKFIIAD